MIATLFYQLRGIEVIIMINEFSGSINIRNHSLIILRLLTCEEDAKLVYSAFHAVFQIYQKEIGIMADYLKLLNERVSLCITEWVG